MTPPTKLGLVTLHALSWKLIKLITKFKDKMQEWLTSDQFQKVLDLLECLEAVFEDVPQYPEE